MTDAGQWRHGVMIDEEAAQIMQKRLQEAVDRGEELNEEELQVSLCWKAFFFSLRLYGRDFH